MKPLVPDMLIFVIENKLSDGSIVFDVQLGGIKLPAISEEDAEQMAEKIRDAIDDHSTMTVDVVYED